MTADESLAESVLLALRDRGESLAIVESCTGGALGAAIASVPGASAVFDSSLALYSSSAKLEILGLSAELLEREGAVSEVTVRAMAARLLEIRPVDWALAVSGISGPGGGSAEKPVGRTCIAWQLRGEEACSESYDFSGDRATVQLHAVRAALRALLAAVRSAPKRPKRPNRTKTKAARRAT